MLIFSLLRLTPRWSYISYRASYEVGTYSAICGILRGFNKLGNMLAAGDVRDGASDEDGGSPSVLEA